MNFLDKTFGRLGNRLFQMAFCYAYSQFNWVDFYFQDPKYFKDYEKDIKKLFGEGIGSDERVAIHVRRGDYVGNPFYVDLTQTDYYLTAVTYFQDSKFLVFSDDIEWCKKNFIIQNCDFSEGKTEEEDLKLMASCKGIIMANSSFSWWGAYLGAEKKVIAPSVKNWYKDGIERTVCPPEWIRI